MKKKVTFNLAQNKIHNTYSRKEYNRHQIDSTLYLFSYNKITKNEFAMVLKELNSFKTQEMSVHIDSIHNTKINS